MLVDVRKFVHYNTMTKKPKRKFGSSYSKKEESQNLKFSNIGVNFDLPKESQRFSTLDLAEIERIMKDSKYKYIPNNFKIKDGVAFQTTSLKIKLDAGLSGLYNMGNTCFLNTAI